MDVFKKEPKGITCLLCAHACLLQESYIGFCGVNQNKQGRLHNLVYAKPSALNIDPIEKKPLYHFLPASNSLSLGTVGCNFKCPFCQNYTLSQNKTVEEETFISPEHLVQKALYHDCDSFSYTYNEPSIFYPYAKDIALLAKKYGLKNIFVSNGFASKELIEDMVGVIDAINVDLKSFDDNYYKKTLKGRLFIILENLKRLVHLGIHVEITTLLIPSITKEQISEMAAFIKQELGSEVPWHFSAFFPNYKMLNALPSSLEMLYTAKEIAENTGLKHVYLGNINENALTYCPQCHNEVIIRQGFRVIHNNLENGHCPKCHYKLYGIFT